MSDEYIPRRGDIVWLDFYPQAGHGQAGRRPALVLSPEPYNRKVGLMLCCAVTTRMKGYPFEVNAQGATGSEAVVLADQIKSLDWRARQVEFKTRVPLAVTKEVIAKAVTLLNP